MSRQSIEIEDLTIVTHRDTKQKLEMLLMAGIGKADEEIVKGPAVFQGDFFKIHSDTRIAMGFDEMNGRLDKAVLDFDGPHHKGGHEISAPAFVEIGEQWNEFEVVGGGDFLDFCGVSEFKITVFILEEKPLGTEMRELSGVALKGIESGMVLVDEESQNDFSPGSYVYGVMTLAFWKSEGVSWARIIGLGKKGVGGKVGGLDALELGS